MKSLLVAIHLKNKKKHEEEKHMLMALQITA